MSTVRKADCCGNCANTTDAFGKFRIHDMCLILHLLVRKTEVCDEFKEIENK